jgi:hypothetical protein
MSRAIGRRWARMARQAIQNLLCVGDSRAPRGFSTYIGPDRIGSGCVLVGNSIWSDPRDSQPASELNVSWWVIDEDSVPDFETRLHNGMVIIFCCRRSASSSGRQKVSVNCGQSLGEVFWFVVEPQFQSHACVEFKHIHAKPGAVGRNTGGPVDRSVVAEG